MLKEFGSSVELFTVQGLWLGGLQGSRLKCNTC